MDSRGGVGTGNLGELEAVQAECLIWPAPAKLNLMLRIIGRRADGYHRIQTVFQFVDIHDRLKFRLRDDGRICRVNSIPGLPEARDLTVRAAKLLRQASNGAVGVDIELEKRLPIGGGLGGGSSDAATVLVALNQLWRIGLEEERLVALGLLLGADVPVFIRGHAAWAEGVGEELTPVALPEPWYLILAPACHVSTAAIFSDPDLTRNTAPITIHGFLKGDRVNDTKPIVCRRYPLVREAFEWLGHYAEPRITGTGACLFAAFDRESEAKDILLKVPQGIRGFVTRGLNRSLLNGLTV